jgi:SH3-like domain-containing protein
VADDITWVQVREGGGTQGWMSAKYLDMVAAVSADVATVPGREPVQLPHPTQYRLTDSDVRLRKRPGIRAAILTTLSAGTVVDDDGADTDETNGHVWRRVRAGEHTGWVAMQFLEAVAGTMGAAAPVPAQARPKQYRLTDSDVRLRERPGTRSGATVLATLNAGTVVDDDGADTVEANGHTWRRVCTGGKTGWVATQFLVVAGGEQNGHAPEMLRGMGIMFNANAATEIQVQQWTCAIRSTMWLLKSIGKPVTPEEAQDAMSPRYCNSDFGLLDASGAGIVEVLRDTWGVTAFNRNPVSFDDVVGWSGRCPVAIGGRNWGGPSFGHWSAVRGVNDDGEIVLANPAGNGPRFGQQTLNRDQWERMGSFSAVVIAVE